MKRTRRTSRGICDFVNVIEYIKHGKYPKDATDGEKRSLRKRSKSFRLDGDNLYYLMNTTETSDGDSPRHDRLVLLTDEQRLEVIAEAHVDAGGVHLGREKATTLINKKYYWVGVSNMVREYSRACQVCRANRAAQSQAYELYRSQITTAAKEDEEFNHIETASTLSSSMTSTSSDLGDDCPKMEWQTPADPVAFGEVVELSVLGPYKNDKKVRYVVVFLDVFSSWPEAYILEKVTPADITHLVMKWVCRFGVMQNLNVNYRPACSLNQCQPLTKVLKSQGFFDVHIQQCSNAWNSSAKWNEVEEVVVGFIENNEGWYNCLDFALLPLRISRGKDAEYTPSYLTFGREFRLPVYLSHREDVSSASASLDPHLTPEQMQCSTNLLVQLYKEYTSDKSKEVKERNAEDETDFKVPTSSNLSGRKRGRRRKADKEVEEDDDYDVTDNTEGSEDDTDILPKGARKRKPKYCQQLKDNKHVKTETALDGDSEQCDQDVCKVSLDVFYRSIINYLKEQTYLPGSSENLKQAVRKAHSSYSLEDGKLMYNMGSTDSKQVIITLKDRMELLKSTHINSKGNHMPGGHVTKELSQYYWRGMVADCQAFVAACPVCDAKHPEKKKNLQDVALMASIRKFEKVAEVAEKHYSLLIQYLQKSKFPPSTVNIDKTAVEKIAGQFKLVKGVLYLIDKSSSMCVEIASRARKMAIKSAHTRTGSDVPSFDQLCAEIVQKYIWHGLTKDVHQYLTTLENTAHEGTTVRPTNVEKKRLQFLEYFKDEKAFFEKHERNSVTKSTQDKDEENNGSTGIELDMHVSEYEDESEGDDEEISMSSQSESQPTDEAVGGKTSGSEVSEGTDTEVGLSNYISNTSNKVYVVSTTRNPTENESAITVHITEESDKDNKIDAEETSVISEKESVMRRKSQLSDLGEGGLVQLANALALVSDPLTEAAVQSIIPGSESSQKGKVTPPQNITNKATKSTDNKTSVISTNVQSQSSRNHGNQQDTEKVTDEATGDGKKKRTCLFTCDICKQVVRGNVKFKIHLAKHKGQKPFQCEVCEKQFTNIKSKRLHMRRHTGVTPYLCNLCGKKFSLVGSLKAHIKIHEKGGNVKMICKICDRVFATKNRYERHMQFKHPNTPPVYKCDACSKFFTTSRSLRRHTMSFHMNVKYHLCGVCGKSFFRKEYLTSHLAQHQGLSGARKAPKKREFCKAEHTYSEKKFHFDIGPTVVQPQVQDISEPATIMVDSSGLSVSHSDIQNIPQAELQTIQQSDVQNISSSVVGHIGPSGVTRQSQEALETYQATHIVASGDVASDNIVPVTLYSNSPVHYTDSGAPVENTFYTIETPSQDDEQQVAHTVVYGYPAVQYEVECSSGAEQLNSEDLSAINLLAQASVCQGNESIAYVTHGYQ